MAENFTAKQKEIVARKLGYDGPMQGFDDFISSSPSLEMKYATLSDKFAKRMAKGGVVKKFAAGGSVLQAEVAALPQTQDALDALLVRYSPAELAAAFPQYGSEADYAAARQQAEQREFIDWQMQQPAIAGQGTIGDVYATQGITDPKQDPRLLAQAQEQIDRQASRDDLIASAGMAPTPVVAGGGTPTLQQIANTPGMGVGGIGVNVVPLPTTPTTTGTTGTTPPDGPVMGAAPTYTAAQTSTTGLGAQAVLAGPTTAATVAPAVEAAGVTAPAPIVAPTVTAAQSAPGVQQALTGVTAEQGTLSQQAQVTAAQQDPRTTAVSGLTAAQGEAARVVAPADRVLQAGEMVSGSAVDMAKVDTELAKTQAAQGVVTEEMTVQGQLNKLTKDFDAGNPPPWAAASIRAATAQLAARGLGASSLAGQAIIQATLEAATPIAAADAKVFEQMGLQNLSNRQQIAVLVGQQRAQFLGQEFDQNFQSRVLNAAKISDIANKNFDAATTIALENARLTNTMNLANLSSRNALILEEAAAMSRLETQNLNNRQQAAVQNAQNFLQIDMKNLENRQQTAIFKAQAIVNSLVSDAGFENATRATNATNKLEADKISATLALTAQQFSASEKNKLAVANMDAANELAKFNAQEANDRDDFNAKMYTEINAANARLLAEVSTANTAATNAANAVNAKNATDLTAAQYAQQSQTYRDLLEMSWKTGEYTKDRIEKLAIAMITRDSEKMKLDSAESKSWGDALFKLGIAIWGT